MGWGQHGTTIAHTDVAADHTKQYMDYDNI